MKTLKIGLDIDGVLAEFEQHFLQYLGLPLHGAEAWDDPRFTENFQRIADDEHFWLTIPPILKGDELTFEPAGYVTARPIRSEISRQWLSGHNFPEVPLVTVGHDMSKVTAMKKLGIDLFLDDGIHNYKELNENGVRCFLITRNHNKHEEVGGDRYDSLKHFQEELRNGSVFDNISTNDDLEYLANTRFVQ